MNKTARGFTLIELMIVVAIIGVIAAVAYPSYQNSLIKNRRSAAQTLLADIAQREQQYMMDNRSYVASHTTLGVTVPTDVSNYYTVTVTVSAGPPPAFTATAAPLTGSSQVSDGPLALTNNGTKTRTPSGGTAQAW